MSPAARQTIEYVLATPDQSLSQISVTETQASGHFPVGVTLASFD